MSELIEDIDFEKQCRNIGNASNYYGGARVAEIKGKYYWDIENYSGVDAEEIPFYLYEALNAFQDSLEKGK